MGSRLPLIVRFLLFLDLLGWALQSSAFSRTSVTGNEHAKAAGRTLYDAILIGGSSAGLSAALTLGRSLRRALVIDDGRPCNEPAPRSHNFLTRDGSTDLLRIARTEVEAYATVDFYDGRAVDCCALPDRTFSVTTQENDTFHARKLCLATGTRDLVPDDIVGLEECWGKSAIHCPYCHGYEFRNKTTGFLLLNDNTNTDQLRQMVPIIHHLTPDLCVLANGNNNNLGEELLGLLARHQISLVSAKLKEIRHLDGSMSLVVLEDGTEYKMDAVYLRPPFQQASDLPRRLGLAFDENGYVAVDDHQRASVDGVFCCGDCASSARAVSIAVASGTRAAKMLNYELAVQDYFEG